MRSVFVCPTYAGRRFQRAALDRRSYKLDVVGGHDGPVPPNCTLPCPRHSYSQPTDRSRAKRAIGRPRIGSTKKNTLEALWTIKPFLFFLSFGVPSHFHSHSKWPKCTPHSTLKKCLEFSRICGAQCSPYFHAPESVETFSHYSYVPEQTYKSIPTRSHSRHLYTHTANFKVQIQRSG